MATFSERAAASALKVIKAKGVVLTLTRRGTNAVFDPAAGAYSSAGTPQTSPLNAVVLPYTSGQIRDSADGRGADETYAREQTKSSLRKLLAAAASATFQPEAGDEVGSFEESVWEVLGCVPLSPAGTPIIYTLVVRKK